jgi:hypothetical protein
MPYKDREKERERKRIQYAKIKEDPEKYKTHLVKQNKRASNNKRGLRNSQLKYNYGIDLTAYEYLLELQNNKCAICNVLFNSSGSRMTVPMVDHEHKISGKVRGLLCSHCNTALGSFRDSKEMLQNALKYLEESEYVLEVI